MLLRNVLPRGMQFAEDSTLTIARWGSDAAKYVGEECGDAPNAVVPIVNANVSAGVRWKMLVGFERVLEIGVLV